MASPLRPPTALPPQPSRCIPGHPRAGRSAAADVRHALLLACLVAGLAGCAGPEPRALSAEEIERDQATREALVASIADDHRMLADLISSDRYAETSVIHTDPELRAIALRLIERTRELAGLAETNVLAPGAP